jgi:hypothetical protein
MPPRSRTAPSARFGLAGLGVSGSGVPGAAVLARDRGGVLGPVVERTDDEGRVGVRLNTEGNPVYPRIGAHTFPQRWTQGLLKNASFREIDPIWCSRRENCTRCWAPEHAHLGVPDRCRHQLEAARRSSRLPSPCGRGSQLPGAPASPCSRLLNQAGRETDLTPTVKPNATQSWLLQQPHAT